MKKPARIQTFTGCAPAGFSIVPAWPAPGYGGGYFAMADFNAACAAARRAMGTRNGEQDT